MTAITFLLLGGLAAFGFLIVVWRRRELPKWLRAILVLAAAAVVVFVVWTLLVAVGIIPGAGR